MKNRPQTTVSQSHGPPGLSAFIDGLIAATAGFQILNAGAQDAESKALLLKGVELVQNLCETYSTALREHDAASTRNV